VVPSRLKSVLWWRLASCSRSAALGRGLLRYLTSISTSPLRRQVVTSRSRGRRLLPRSPKAHRQLRFGRAEHAQPVGEEVRGALDQGLDAGMLSALPTSAAARARRQGSTSTVRSSGPGTQAGRGPDRRAGRPSGTMARCLRFARRAPSARRSAKSPRSA
jgi:hypothetical protein